MNIVCTAAPAQCSRKRPVIGSSLTRLGDPGLTALSRPFAFACTLGLFHDAHENFLALVLVHALYDGHDLSNRILHLT